MSFRSPPRQDHRADSSGERLHTSLPDDSTTEGFTHSTTTYRDYPGTQPFIYDDYRRDPAKPDSAAYPESNRQAVMSALRGLQDKIRRLELERTNAEKNLRTLATETSRYEDILHQDKSIMSDQEVSDNREGTSYARPREENSRLYPGEVTFGADTTQGTDVHGKLESAEQRCHLLERQLQCMRKMVSGAEHDQTRAKERSALLDRQRQEDEVSDVRAQMDKVSELEREHFKLTATQTLAESRIRELEEKLREEMHYRKMMQDRAVELETAAEANRIIQEATGKYPATSLKTKKTKKKKKQTPRGVNGTAVNGVVSSRSNSARSRPSSGVKAKKPGMEPMEHYKLNLAEIPFIAGQSTGPSHSLAANFQEVLSLMKTHNPQLCTSPRSHSRNMYRHLSPTRVMRSRSAKSAPSSLKNGAELSSLLLQLQEEFTQLSVEHEELARQIAESRDKRAQEDLERELDHVVAKMEAKGDQIARLSSFRDELHQTKKKLKSAEGTGTMSSGYGSTGGTLPMATINGEVEVTTTIRTKGKGAGPLVVAPDQSNKAQASLNLYKDLKKIQTTLRKDDISWD